jgi:hypothetical protein
MHPSPAFPDPGHQRTLSYVVGLSEPMWGFPDNSFIRLPPPRRHTRRRRSPAWRARAAVYSATLAGDDYLEEAREALRAGDDAAARHHLAVLRGIIEVALGQLLKPSGECRTLL